MSDEAIRAAAHDPGERPPPRPRDAERGELRVLPALAGGLLLALGARRQGRLGTVSAAAGVGLLVHALVPVFRHAIVRQGAARRAIDLESTLVVDRAVRDVFAFCANFENFPSLVHALAEVEDHGDGRSRWVLRHTDGSLVEWNAIVTKFVPNQVIGWESVPGSAVESRGIVRFRALEEERTELAIHLTYAQANTTFEEAWHALFSRRTERAVSRELSLAGEVLERWDPSYEPAPPTPMTPSMDEDG
jgi:uncharacterized membrane protein